MKHANFPWPPVVVRVTISTFCFLFTCARELFFLHIYMLISEINYSAPRISKYNFWPLLHLIWCNFVDETLACTRELFSWVHPVLYYLRTSAWRYWDVGMAVSDLQLPAIVWMSGFRFGARGPLCLQSSMYRVFFHWKKCSEKNNPNRNCSSRKVTWSEFRADNTQISCATV